MGSLCSGALEQRFLTAPLFTRSQNFKAALMAGSNAYASDKSDNQAFGIGDGYDGSYQSGVVSSAAITGYWKYGNGVTFASASESSSVTTSVTGPGSGVPSDPNPDKSAQIQINVQHSGQDSFSNNTPNPIDPRVLLDGAREDSRATSGDETGNSLAYVTTDDAAFITVKFQATISASGDRDKFTAGASLTLNSTFLSVTVDQQNGLVATDWTGKVVLRDANFDQLPTTDSQQVSVRVPNVLAGTNLEISYDSSVASSVGGRGRVVGQPPGGDGRFPSGTLTNNVTFNWTLTYNIR